jgi:hypothetical protein
VYLTHSAQGAALEQGFFLSVCVPLEGTDNTCQSLARALASALLPQSADGPHELPPVEMCVYVCVLVAVLVPKY